MPTGYSLPVTFFGSLSAFLISVMIIRPACPAPTISVRCRFSILPSRVRLRNVVLKAKRNSSTPNSAMRKKTRKNTLRGGIFNSTSSP